VTTPSFVGAGTPIYTAPFDSSAGFTVTTGNLPAGIQTNDLLFICVLANGAPSAFNNNAAYLSSDLTTAGYNNVAFSFTATQTSLQLFIGTYDSAEFPMSITRNALSLVPTAARIETIAYRYVDNVPTSGTSDDGTNKQASHSNGRAAQFSFKKEGSIGAVVDGYTTTERYRQAEIVGFGGGFVVADTTVSQEDFVNYAPSGAFSELKISVGMDPDGSPEPFTPGPRGVGGWGVGETKGQQW
jgi:hypothetical protein